jgi:hypothetical protein
VFWKPEAKVSANILSRLFDSLKKENVHRISLQGVTGGALVASSLLWLVADSDHQIELTIDGRLAIGVTGGKISVEITTLSNDSWTIQEWHLHKVISNTVVTPEEEANPAKSLVDFCPANSAKSVLQAQYSLDNSQIETVGEIAAALIEVAVEKGLIMSDMRQPGVKPRFVPLMDLCQTHYKSSITKALDCFGWKSEMYSKSAAGLAQGIRDWIHSGCPGLGTPQRGTGNPLFDRPVKQVWAILDTIRKWQSTQTGCTAETLDMMITEPAIHVAAESLYSCVCSLFPKYRSFRACHFSTIADNAMSILSAIFSRPLEKALAELDPPIVISQLHSMNTLTICELRVRAMASLIPGATAGSGHDGGIGNKDLIFSKNGYVAMANPLRHITTRPSECIAISVMAGYLRWDEEDASFEKLIPVEPRGDEGSMVGTEPSTLNPYDIQGQYLGLELRGDRNAVTVEHQISDIGKQLSLTTYLCQPQNQDRTRVDFISSIEGIVTATHITASSLPSFLEESQAQEWRDKNVWRSIRWTTANGRIVHTQGTPIRYISMTYDSQPLRFFLAGRRSMQKLLIRHGSTPLVACIQEALRYEETEGEMPRDFSKPVGQVPWIENQMIEQMTYPGWLIIS